MSKKWNEPKGKEPFIQQQREFHGDYMLWGTFYTSGKYRVDIYGKNSKHIDTVYGSTKRIAFKRARKLIGV